MGDAWRYVKNGQSFGPFTFEQLRQLALSGLLAPGDMVMSEEAPTWVSAGTVPRLPFPSPPAPSDVARSSTTQAVPTATSRAAAPGAESSGEPQRSWPLTVALWLGFFGWLSHQFGDSGPGRRGIVSHLLVGAGGVALVYLAGRAVLAGESVDFNGRLRRRPVLFRIGGLLILLVGGAMALQAARGLLSTDGVGHAAPADPGGAATQPARPVREGPGVDEFVSFGNGEEVYYEPGFRSQAERVGEALKAIRYFDGQTPKAVRLGRHAATWVLRVYLLRGVCEDHATQSAFRQSLGVQIAGFALPGEPLEIDLCDESLAVRAKIPVVPSGHVAIGPQAHLFYTGPLGDTAGRLAEYLRGQLGEPGDIALFLSRRASSWVLTLHWAGPEEPRPDQWEALQVLARDCSARVFQGEPVVLEVLDRFLRVKRTITSSSAHRARSDPRPRLAVRGRPIPRCQSSGDDQGA